MAANRLADAKVNLETAAGLEPNKSRVWLALARTYWKLHESAKANDAAKKAARLATATDAQVYQLLALYYGDSAQPLKSCDMQLEFAKVGNPDAGPKALECYQQAVCLLSCSRNRSISWRSRSFSSRKLSGSGDDAGRGLGLEA